MKESRKRMRERKKVRKRRKGEKRGEKQREEEGIEREEGDMPQERRESAAGERPENHPLRAKFENCIGWLL